MSARYNIRTNCNASESSLTTAKSPTVAPKRRLDATAEFDDGFHVLKRRLSAKSTLQIAPPTVAALDTVGAAKSSAMRSFDSFLHSYISRQDRCDAETACEASECDASNQYHELSGIASELLASMEAQVGGKAGDREYEVVQFQGQSSQSKLSRQSSSTSSDCSSSESNFSGPVNKAKPTQDVSQLDSVWHPLCAVLACLASRPEKTWLEAFDAESELTLRRKMQLPESLDDSIRAMLKRIESCVAKGYFACGLRAATCTIRVSFVRDASANGMCRPASLLLTHSVPFRTALAKMDGGGPMREPPRKWCRREFAFQDLAFGELASRGGRCPASGLEVDARITELFRSRAPVLYLDAVAALAPREAAKEHGVSNVVKAELSGLLREAKERGQAVVFMLGGDKPHVLAEKVYLRAPFTDHGLRCGYLRWREAASEPWAREKPEDQRVCVGIQMP